MDALRAAQPTMIGAVLLAVEGRVQGVGFRPFVRRLARSHGLAGWVRNDGGRVTIRIEGPEAARAAFSTDLIDRPPPLARPRLVAVHHAVCEGLRGFSIVASEYGERTGTLVPPDHFACADCLAEMRDPAARRYRYPFINCTQCGPRYTIIDRLPYDRANISMAGFVLCPACRLEYDNLDDRRHHAQPLACATCGPQLRLHQPTTGRLLRADTLRGEAALAAAVRSLRAGSIVAVKGIGGFHLLCDARSELAVDRLRQRKRRPEKPLAVMVRALGADGLGEVRTIASPCVAAQRALIDPVRPIVLVPKRKEADIAPGIASGLGELGILLPYSPLHALLLDDFGGPLVATSGNRSGDPVETAETSAIASLAGVADVFLLHDRPIRRPADDPVYQIIAGRARPVRLGRGNAPLQLRLPDTIERPTLAVGGQMKSTVALAWDDRVVVSPHIGDLGSPRAHRIFSQVIADLQELFGIRAEAVVCDLHPDFSSTRWARRTGLPVLAVPHHHAHASALAGEHPRCAPLLVFTWDGVGLGEDGTLWGGEALLGSPGQWRRLASLRPFRLPGGERVAREPWRSALGLCWEVSARWPAAPKDSELLRRAWERRLNAPTTSSAGRLFDAAAALVGLVEHATYEGQGPMLLEAAATDGPTIELPLSRRGELIIADWAPLLPCLLDASQSIGRRSATFHDSLALAINSQAVLIRHQTGVTSVGLTGGVFQNRRLTERAVTLLKKSGFDVLLADAVPPNDAGLSFGQLVEAAGRQSDHSCMTWAQ